MGLLFRLAELLIVLLPLAGGLYAAVKAFTAAQRRRDDQPATEPARADGEREPQHRSVANQAAQWRAITRVVAEHQRTDARWLDYELDYAKLLDYPLMTDMRDPLTTAFHKAKLHADLLRPAKAEDLLDDPESADRYRAAVEDYVTAFAAAETEAHRRRRDAFTDDGRQRISRAQRLLRVASDTGATPQEREQAYQRAGQELDGLIVLPPATRAAIERGIAGELGGG